MCEYTLCYLDNRSAVGVMAHNTQHNKASLHLVKRIDCVGFSDVSGISTTRLVAGVISAVVEKVLGEKELWL